MTTTKTTELHRLTAAAISAQSAARDFQATRSAMARGKVAADVVAQIERDAWVLSR